MNLIMDINLYFKWTNLIHTGQKSKETHVFFFFCLLLLLVKFCMDHDVKTIVIHKQFINNNCANAFSFLFFHLKEKWLIYVRTKHACPYNYWLNNETEVHGTVWWIFQRDGASFICIMLVQGMFLDNLDL